MCKKINEIFFYAKVVLLLVVFGITMYIMFSMNAFYDNYFVNVILLFIPFVFTLMTFILSFFTTKGSKNLFFNIACFVALIALLYISIRTISDQNMIMWSKNKMNFYYFENQIKQFKILLYLMFGVNLLLLLKKKKYADNDV